MARTKLNAPFVLDDGRVCTVGEAIVELLRQGVSVEVAADVVGMHAHSIHRWITRGSAGLDQMEAVAGPEPSKELAELDPYEAFAIQVMRARATAEATSLFRIREAGRGGAVIKERTIRHKDGTEETLVEYARPEWTADAWYLERTHPERYRRRTEVTGKDGGPMQTEEVGPDALRAKLVDFQKRREERDKRTG